jgi:hypothetical protein
MSPSACALSMLLASCGTAIEAHQPQSFTPISNIGPSTPRRHFVAAAVAAAAAPTVATAAAPSSADAAARADAVERLLSRVPVFVVTNAQGQPYLTEVDEDGRRFGSIFIGPGDATDVLLRVREFDRTATLAVVPLSTVYLDVAKTAREAAAARAVVAQPKSSTSTDMRLFRLSPLSDREREETSVSMLPGGTLLPGVNLFYEPSLYLGADEATRQQPFFFRLSDLNMVWRRGGGDARNSGQVSPTLRVVSLERLLSQAAAGEITVPPMLMPPSETAELEYRASSLP